MKNFYLLIILLVSGFGFAQSIGDYNVTTTLKIRPSSGSYGGSCRNDVRINMLFTTGTPELLINEGLSSTSRDQYTVFQSTRIISSTRKFSKIQVTASRNWKRKIGGCGGSGSFNDALVESTQFNSCTNTYSDIVRWWDDQLTIVKTPNLIVVNPGIFNDLPTETKITVKSNTGFLPTEYRWQYSFNPPDNRDPNSPLWINLPQYNGVSSFTANAVDILGNNVMNYVGKPIYFRQKACDIVSDPVRYNVRLSAPKVLSAIAVQPTCSDSKDGAVKLVFNRILFPDEQLTYTLLDLSTGTPSNYNGNLLIDSNKNFNISGIQAGKYTLQLVGFINGLNTSTSPDSKDLFAIATFEIASPPILDFTLDATNVQCYNGGDGTITISPTGGTRATSGNDYYSLDNGLTWIPFANNKAHIITGLTLGTYKIKVKDMMGCIAKIQTLVEGNIKLGDDKILEKTISQPLSPLALNYTLKTEPTFYGAANGKIVAAISGGTINDDKTYAYEWKNSSGVVFPATGQYNTADKTYNITLENVPQGEYKLTVKDKNYNSAVNKANCSIIESSQVLIEPAKIEITLEQTQKISCNTENHDPLIGDPAKLSDAILTATVIGGIKFTGSANNGLPYKFTWSKYNTDTSSWEKLTDYKTDTAANLGKGNYSLNVEDANGIVQGTYNTIDLVTATPTTKEIAEPTKLELSFTSGNVSCHDGNNGWATANVTGGAGDYTYIWYNTGGGIVDANKISQLVAGTYTVEVKDKNKCSITRSIEITEPQSPVVISYKKIFTPTFSGATNGRIIAEIKGGTPFDGIENNGKLYNYEWKNKAGGIQTTTAALENGIYTITMNGVPADDYFLTIKDKNYNEATSQIANCSVLESPVTLNEPDPLKVVFEIVRTISCNTSNEFGNAKDTTPNDGQRDESQDGILVAHVTGGTPLAATINNGLPYYFYWKKQQQDGTWLPLTNITGETAINLSHGNYALNVEDRNGIRLGTYVNNLLTQEIDVEQFMQEPPKLSVTITQGNVFCNGGNDGWATANVTGGTAPYTYKWSNGVETKENTVLKAGTYTVFVTDFKECATQASVIIKEPATPLAIKYTEVLNPSFYKATNGKIVVEVTGGTIQPDNSYWFEWKNSKGIKQTTTTTAFSNGVYTITLNGVGEELYSLTVRDANYNAATNKASCTVANSVTALDDPDPLEVTFEVVRTISCNVSNQFGNETDVNPQDSQRDESQDGILVAHVKGGIQLDASKNNGLPYYYTWKKQNGNSWVIWNDHDETAENISNGNYALNIEDANGIKLGTYVNNLLVEEKDVTQNMPEPAKLQLTFTKFDVGCTTGDDGWAEAHVSGGTAPYTYEWTNGETTSKIENITTNNYFVIATDAKGCIIQGSIFVGDPNGIFTTETVKNPTCYKGNDAAIELNVTGGNLPYSYLWNTGATTKDLNNLTAGNYEVAITCPDCCVYKKKFILKDPEPVIVNIGADRTLCIDQNLDLDATIADKKATYSWTSTNGFTSNEAKIKVSKSGTYHVKVTSGLGCIGEDEIVIKTSQTAISSEFLLSSQAYLDEEVILINTSNPFGESTNWVLPKGVKVVEQKEKYITLKFDATGVYSIGLEQTQGECYAVYNKNITVEQRSTLPNGATASQFIVDFIVTPNPSNGNFKALVTLENTSAINLRLFSTTGQNTMIQKKESGKKKYEIDFETSLESGMYVLVLETGQQTLVKKIIIY
ncbi:T9SS type A sorting domain-containing protein [Flavobacterium sp.]|uniref:T9SS type A sorting domain-containing protein n=1 Tax=Flavobacterium sp. TaxID=239 RepID=UPI00374D333E